MKGRVQSDKMKCDKTLGEGDFVLFVRGREKKKRLVERTKMEKTESRMLISQQPVCGTGETRVRQAKPKQDNQGYSGTHPLR